MGLVLLEWQTPPAPRQTSHYQQRQANYTEVLLEYQTFDRIAYMPPIICRISHITLVSFPRSRN